ncbi:MAG: hypothetical protein IPM23_12570 [Candidatus Melainabacteria bacterium]|nr:hypothetical protein [Candidatus Melainabacteria bacterium]
MDESAKEKRLPVPIIVVGVILVVIVALVVVQSTGKKSLVTASGEVTEILESGGEDSSVEKGTIKIKYKFTLAGKEYQRSQTVRSGPGLLLARGQSIKVQARSDDPSESHIVLPTPNRYPDKSGMNFRTMPQKGDQTRSP